ncbi:transcription antitermination factor NusB [Fibrobacter succinogenes]|uniref:16S rRNA (Cytosine967-C5)-methyltransferase n=1 Tax=Fibrobacter succinogenes TaxID=833 RepID=A0A380S7T7_FIBSU|nr:transcription antitermination factor NusB [Fibrobacter succinogenes]PWJ33538.1 16S rRNA (cytosine967-C5)-methyltransferase [Fibrobacter succinogenes subsp. elongatus]SUQ25909.1 16S rRNA (cytosine967-C5)-methyltransferase [Fibrobacter succinogenes]
MLTEREEAFRVLLLWQRDGSFIKESGLSPFAMELALGVCRRHLYLEYFVKSLTKKLPSLEARVILEMGLFQMFFMDVPDYAAINDSVELAKSANLGESTARLVNAVLRTARRQGEPALPPQRVRRVSVENSVPEWLVRRWFDVYGGDRAEALAKATLERPTEWIRVNLQKTSAPVLAEKIGITGASILYDRFIEIPRDVGVKLLLALPEFVKGEFSFQNPSAFEVVKLLDLKPGLKVWDACAAPGGKTALMAEMDSSLEILASDSSASRLEKMQDLMNRLGLTNIKTEVIDLVPASATAPQHSSLSSLVSRLSSKFDRILLDVPCSNMGVIARRPESVYRMTPESINEVAELQFKILENASAALAPGGRLVYATCSPDPTETTRVIARFVKAHPEFVKVGEPVLPGLKDSRLDGFFAQALEYKK